MSTHIFPSLRHRDDDRATSASTQPRLDKAVVTRRDCPISTTVDGSYNMVADDGQICGTAPEWGYPLWCCQQLWLRSGNLSWLQRLYPGAAAYLRWWLDHRL